MAERLGLRARRRPASLAVLAMLIALPSARAISAPPAGDDHYVPIELVLRLGERRLYVIPVQHDHDPRHALASFPVAVGRSEYATPTGRFKVKEKLVAFTVTRGWRRRMRLFRQGRRRMWFLRRLVLTVVSPFGCMLRRPARWLSMESG